MYFKNIFIYIDNSVLDVLETTIDYYRGYGERNLNVAKFRQFLQTGKAK